MASEVCFSKYIYHCRKYFLIHPISDAINVRAHLVEDSRLLEASVLICLRWLLEHCGAQVRHDSSLMKKCEFLFFVSHYSSRLWLLIQRFLLRGVFSWWLCSLVSAWPLPKSIVISPPTKILQPIRFAFMTQFDCQFWAVGSVWKLVSFHISVNNSDIFLIW